MNLKEGYIANWKNYPTDEVKVRVARPGPLGTPKELGKRWTDGKIEWHDFELEYLLHVMTDDKALTMIMEILAMLKAGKTVRLMCYEKKAPCHRFTLKKAIETLFEQKGREVLT